MSTFKIVCNPDDANATLVALRSLKTPEESDDFVHVALAQLGEKELIIKLQTPGPLLKRELEISEILKGKNNIVTHICDFPCLFNDIIWMSALKKPASLCEETGTPYHMIIMEYINNDLATFLEQKVYSHEMFLSIIQQVGLSLMEIHMNTKVSQGDINRGNMLLEIGTPKDIIYTIGDRKITVNTYGNEVVWIDFQRGSLFNKYKNKNILFQSAKDDISVAYELMSKWVKNTLHKEELVKRMNETMDAESVDELFQIITNPMIL